MRTLRSALTWSTWPRRTISLFCSFFMANIFPVARSRQMRTCARGILIYVHGSVTMRGRSRMALGAADRQATLLKQSSSTFSGNKLMQPQRRDVAASQVIATETASTRRLCQLDEPPYCGRGRQHLSEGAAAYEGERLEVGGAHALALQPREVTLAPLEQIDDLLALRLRQLPLLQLLLQLPSPAAAHHALGHPTTMQ